MAGARIEQRVVPCPALERFVSDAGDLYLIPPSHREQLIVEAPLGVLVGLLLTALEQGSSLECAVELCVAKAHESRTVDPAELAPTLRAIAAQLIELELVRPAEFSTGELVGESAIFDRQGRYFAQCGVAPADAQRRLSQARVLVLGLGGVGSAAAEALARAGIGSLIGIDPERVEAENLPRQTLYAPADIGRTKAEVAQRRLCEVAPGADVSCLELRVESVEDARELLASHEPDFLVNAADTPAYDLAQWIGDACFQAGTPFVSGGQRPPTLTAGPLYIPGTTACHRCTARADQPSVDEELLRARTRAGFVIPALGPADQIVGNLIAAAAIDLISGAAEPSLVGASYALNLHTLQSHREDVPGARRCRRCAADGDHVRGRQGLVA